MGLGTTRFGSVLDNSFQALALRKTLSKRGMAVFINVPALSNPWDILP